jgi:hypothetical protein
MTRNQLFIRNWVTVVSSQRFAFVVKVWNENIETTPDSVVIWRGSVQRVGAEQVRYFSRFDQLTHILQDLTGLNDPAEPSRDESAGETNSLS